MATLSDLTVQLAERRTIDRTIAADLILDPARQHGPVRLEQLAGDLQTEAVEAGEGSQVRAREGSVRHVEVFRTGCVRTPIIGRPRPSPRHRRAAPGRTTATPSSVKSPFSTVVDSRIWQGVESEVAESSLVQEGERRSP